MRAAARYLKGCEMLEPYAMKVARTVLRRGDASNRILLSLRKKSFRAEKHTANPCLGECFARNFL